jgi:HPt (histidine-containing phosphotransfer) domain-containing protein
MDRDGENPLPVLDPQVIGQLEHDLGGRDAVRGVAEVFLERLEPDVHLIGQAALRHDARALANTAHVLRSSAAAFGALRLAELAGRLETLGRSGDVSSADGLAAGLPTCARQARAELRAELDRASGV